MLEKNMTLLFYCVYFYKKETISMCLDLKLKIKSRFNKKTTNLIKCLSSKYKLTFGIQLFVFEMNNICLHFIRFN